MFYVLDEVSSLYKLAAVEHAVLRTRNWANLLDLSDLQILEFASDLKVCAILGSFCLRCCTNSFIFYITACLYCVLLCFDT